MAVVVKSSSSSSQWTAVAEDGSCITLSRCSYQRYRTSCSKQTPVWLLPVALVAFMVAYLAFVACGLVYIENLQLKQTPDNCFSITDNLLDDLWLDCYKTNRFRWKRNSVKRLREWFSTVQTCGGAQFTNPPREGPWTFGKGFYCAFSFFTTTGWSGVDPETENGRGFLFLTSWLGFPIFLLLFDQTMNFLHHVVGFLRRKMVLLLSKIFYCLCMCRNCTLDICCCCSGNPCCVHRIRKSETKSDEKSESDGPFLLFLLLLMGYSMIGVKILLTEQKSWNIYDAIYYLHFSCATVGIGDLMLHEMNVLQVVYMYIAMGFLFICFQFIKDFLKDRLQSVVRCMYKLWCPSYVNVAVCALKLPKDSTCRKTKKQARSKHKHKGGELIINCA